jgi:hypothetical protein
MSKSAKKEPTLSVRFPPDLFGQLDTLSRATMIPKAQLLRAAMGVLFADPSKVLGIPVVKDWASK